MFDLAAARHELGLSVSDLARALRLDLPNGRTFVRDMESGRKPVSGPVQAAVELMLKESRYRARVRAAMEEIAAGGIPRDEDDG